MQVEIITLEYQTPHEGNEAYFQGEMFGKIIQFITQNPKLCQLKELKTRLMFFGRKYPHPRSSDQIVGKNAGGKLICFLTQKSETQLSFWVLKV